MPMTDNRFVRIIRLHPLAFVIFVAVLLRIGSVIYSKGYMASDDHFETVDIAYNWLSHGPLDDNGHLVWHDHPSAEISRFPLYTLFLYGIMKLYLLAGVTSLDTMMYGVRAVHALISLLSVFGLYRIVQLVTKAEKWAMVAGLAGAAHFAMPYLAVRNLIEMVGGHIWIIALLLIYLYYDDSKSKWLIWAGVISGLAWMVRFQIAMVALPVPFVLWWQAKSVRPALVYLTGVAVMVLIAGFTDKMFLGPFLGSLINNIIQAGREGALYSTSPFIYVGVLLGVMIPPFSLLLAYLAFRRRFWSKHLLLTATILSTVILHTIMANRQERLILVILPEVILFGVLTLAYHMRSGEILSRKQRLLYWFGVPSVIINGALLCLLTVNYSHKSDVEPLVRIEMDNLAPDEIGTHDVLFVSLDSQRATPLAYGGLEPVGRTYINSWADFKTQRDLTPDTIINEYAVLYPSNSQSRSQMVDSVNRYFGPMTFWRHITSSPVDWLLHVVNPKHNRANEAVILRRAQ